MEIYTKTVVVGAPGMDHGNDIDEGVVYAFTLIFGDTYTEDKKVTAKKGASNDKFGSIIAISGYTLLAGAY